MSGDPNKASIWADADVYINWDLNATKPADENAPFDGSWLLAGLLDGDAGFTESRSETVDDHFGWGGILIATRRRNFKLTRKFIAYEDNAVTIGLVWPGSAAGKRKVPKTIPFLIAFETRDGDRIQRVISENKATVQEVGDISDSESALRQYEITVAIYPTGAGDLFIVQPDVDMPTLVSVAVAPATKALAIGAVAKAVLTATYSDAATRDVTHDATWSSSAPSKATVDHGYVAGVAAGTSNVVGTYGGQSATQAVTVS